MFLPWSKENLYLLPQKILFLLSYIQKVKIYSLIKPNFNKKTLR